MVVERLEPRVLLSASYAISSLAGYLPFGESADEGPLGTLAIDSSGNLYGAYGGPDVLGTIFELPQGSHSLTTLAQFNGSDAGWPEPNLTIDSNGNLFGTTYNGGADGYGRIFELKKGDDTITMLAEFNLNNGAMPENGVIIDSNGNLYGQTTAGGDLDAGGYGDGVGTVFEFANGSNTIKVLAEFDGSDGSHGGGGSQTPSLAIDSNGNLFGTAPNGGIGYTGFDDTGFGTIFEVANGSNTITTLAEFNSYNGKVPNGLIIDSSGNLYGETCYGGDLALDADNGYGSVFELPAGGTIITTLADFNATTGGQPLGNVILDSSGNLYGTNNTGNGSNNLGEGSIFKISSSGSFSILAAFDGANGEDPDGSLVMDSSGNLYGVARGVFEVVGPHLAFASQPSNATAGITISPPFIVDVENGDNSIATTDDSDVTIAIATGPADGVLNGTLTVAAVNGVATFNNLSLDIAGAYTLSATDGSLGDTISFSFTVVPNPLGPAQLVFLQQPTNIVAGNTFVPAVIVAVEDQFGNVVTTDESEVSIALDNSSAPLLGNLTVQADDGIATFFLSMNVTGDFGLQATDGSYTPVDSNDFIVAPAAAEQIAFAQQPTNAVAGIAITPAVTVAVEDQFGNLCESDDSNVTISPSGAGTVQGALSVNAVNGVATFLGLVADTAGSYTLMASNGDFASVTSDSFTVNPAAVATIAFVHSPGNTAAGATLSPAVTAVVKDRFGNLVSSGLPIITIAISSGPAGAVLDGTLTSAASNGVARFNDLSLATAGNYTLTVSDAGFASMTSNAFTVIPDAPVTIRFSRQPANSTAGNVIAPSVAVQVVDQFGNAIAGDTVLLTVASGPTTILLGTRSQTTSGTGFATFANLALDTAGTYTLQATDGSLTPAISNSFTISAAAAFSLVFAQQPTNTVAGNLIAPAVTVDVIDRFNNIVASGLNVISIAIKTGPTGSILGGTLLTAASSGVATFGNLSLSVEGIYTFVATGGGLTNAISGSFTIDAAAANMIKFTAQPTNAIAGSNIGPAISLKVKDAFGNPIAGDTLTLSIVTGPGGASIGGTDTAVTASNGVATFSNVLLTIAGGYTLSVDDGSITSGPSAAITITPGKASQLIFKNVPANIVAGAVIAPAILVKIQDQFGNLCNTNDSTVTLGISNGPAKAKVLTGATVAAVNGVADFADVSLNKAGACVLSAADGKLTPGVSSAITVVHGAAAKFAFEQALPPNATAGAAISPGIAVDVDDAYGNLCSNKNTTITLEVLTGPAGTTPGQAVGGTPSVAAVAGTAMFDDAVLTKSGDYTLQAINGSLNFGASTSITVSAAAAAKMSFKQQPSNAAKGAHISPAITVKIKDAFGNVVATDSSQITIAVATGPGGVLSGTLTVAAVGGLATFSNLSLNVKGVYTLVATGSELTAATSAEFTVG